MLYIGVDPGASGGIAAVQTNGQVYQLEKMPATDVDVLALLTAWREGGAGSLGAHAVLERVAAWRGCPMGPSTILKLGAHWGGLQMALSAVGIAYDVVQPQKWQAAMGCLTGGDKNVSKRRAQALFPGVTITHATADALLMAEYCRRQRSGYGKKEVEGEGQALRPADAGAREQGKKQKGAEVRRGRGAPRSRKG